MSGETLCGWGETVGLLAEPSAEADSRIHISAYRALTHGANEWRRFATEAVMGCLPWKSEKELVRSAQDPSLFASLNVGMTSCAGFESNADWNMPRYPIKMER